MLLVRRSTSVARNISEIASFRVEEEEEEEEENSTSLAHDILRHEGYEFLLSCE